MPEKNRKITTIKLNYETKERLDRLKEADRESYDGLLKKLLGILNLVKSEPDKARGILHKISESHERNFAKEKVSEGIPKENEKKQEKETGKINSGRNIQAKPAIKTAKFKPRFASSSKFLKLRQNR